MPTYLARIILELPPLKDFEKRSTTLHYLLTNTWVNWKMENFAYQEISGTARGIYTYEISFSSSNEADPELRKMKEIILNKNVFGIKGDPLVHMNIQEKVFYPETFTPKDLKDYFH